MTESRSRLLDPAAVRFGPDGLVAAIVQDVADGRVLMLGWQDAEALAATIATGEAHFHSRSRGALWKKGETSGNTLSVVSLELDCDADAVLIAARPAGPTCHTEARSCFDLEPDLAATAAESTTQGFAWLERLWATIEERARTRPEGSYTSRLLDGGVDATVRKVAEEATEVVMAAKDDAVAERLGSERPRVELAGELADLLYHSLVLCAERGLPPSEIIEALKSRHRT
ncbi:MAG TPA: bifunctional phosphoribosyl-AMP cyclohydrolase/phosphoribosyl-ATP diphosphatase HisIE [Anaerolineae bacterium]|nr:bifunctional phosphoribosyl-AMP cyclohydrolase/phosphoribosyl-ATP diphosphatase HisIE [Anaerolineae bacterium]